MNGKRENNSLKSQPSYSQTDDTLSDNTPNFQRLTEILTTFFEQYIRDVGSITFPIDIKDEELKKQRSMFMESLPASKILEWFLHEYTIYRENQYEHTTELSMELNKRYLEIDILRNSKKIATHKISTLKKELKMMEKKMKSMRKASQNELCQTKVTLLTEMTKLNDDNINLKKMISIKTKEVEDLRLTENVDVKALLEEVKRNRRMLSVQYDHNYESTKGIIAIRDQLKKTVGELTTELEEAKSKCRKKNSDLKKLLKKFKKMQAEKLDMEQQKNAKLRYLAELLSKRSLKIRNSLGRPKDEVSASSANIQTPGSESESEASESSENMNPNVTFQVKPPSFGSTKTLSRDLENSKQEKVKVSKLGKSFSGFSSKVSGQYKRKKSKSTLGSRAHFDVSGSGIQIPYNPKRMRKE